MVHKIIYFFGLTLMAVSSLLVRYYQEGLHPVPITTFILGVLILVCGKILIKRGER